MEEVRFAVVGCGNIGMRHLAVLDAEPNAEIAGVCDIVEERCREAASLYGDVPYFQDYEEMLLQTDADVINICTPHGLHAPMSVQASETGRHVLVEKPMALSVDDAERMIAVAQANDVHLMVVKQNRYNVPIDLTTTALTEKRLGRIYMVQCNVLWNRYVGYYQDSTWRGKKELEGGALYTQVVHFLDLMIWWFGDVEWAMADLDTKKQDVEIEDCGNALLRFESGVMGALTWTTCVYNKNYEGSITVIGEEGTIKVGGRYLNEIEFWDVSSYPLPDRVEFIDEPNEYGRYQGTSSNHDRVIHDVIYDVFQDRHRAVEGDEGIRSIKAIEMIYGSVGSDGDQ